MSESKERLDWVEKAGLENIRHHLQAADDLKKDANTALTVFIALLAASFSYFVNAYSAAPINQPIALATGTLTVWLMLLCILLMVKCLWVQDISAPTNEPQNIFHKSESLDEIREIELENLQARITSAAKRNAQTALWLNRLRLAAVLSPILAALTYVIFAWHSSSS